MPPLRAIRCCGRRVIRSSSLRCHTGHGQTLRQWLALCRARALDSAGSGRRCRRTVVCHMSSDEVASSKGCAERQLTSKNTSSNDTCELTSVVTGACGVSSTDAEQVEHGGLRLENCTTTDSTNFDTRHRDRDLEVTAKTGEMLVYSSSNKKTLRTYFFMTVIQLLLSTF